MNQNNSLFISNLPNDVTEFSIIKLLSQLGKITSFNFPVHKEGKFRGRSLGFCFVSYERKSDAIAAVEKLFSSFLFRNKIF